MSLHPRKRAWLLLAVSISIHLVISRTVRLLDPDPPLSSLSKRGGPVPHKTLLALPYDEWYASLPAAYKPFFILVLLLVLSFLFSFIGISASDFFCPNLSTVATQLGLSESTAGVTFLAFGNGSPDVFSTFSALQGGTFGLAVGELIGAASFIISIVVGSIALIKPFHVPKHAFLRDVLFFTAAVLCLILVLGDGDLTGLESSLMVGLYVTYVLVVVGGNWWSSKHRQAKQHRSESPLTPLSPPPTSLHDTGTRSRSASTTTVTNHHHRPNLSSDHSPDVDTPRAAFSLLGAIEFRDVVNSLRKESLSPRMTGSPSTTGEGRADYFGPINTYRRSSSQQSHNPRPRPLPNRKRSSSYVTPTPASATVHDETNPWHDQAGSPHPSTEPGSKPHNLRLIIPGQRGESIPSISIIDPEGGSNQLPPTPEPEAQEAKTSRFEIRRRSRMALRILFPSLQSFRHKSVIGMVLAIVSVPAILALTVTLPVVDDGRGEEGGVQLPVGENEPLHEGLGGSEGENGDGDGERLLTADVGEELHHLVENGFSPLHSPLGRIYHSHSRNHSQEDLEIGLSAAEEQEEEAEEEAFEYHRGLTAVQCVLGPMWCSLIVFRNITAVLVTGGVGLVLAVVVAKLSTDGRAQPWRLIRCFCGFTCAMVWIAAIADEVVSVLTTVGEILGLSDAIIGLTIFAVGNSLADLVANVTVAQFAPAMAYAACFGGPYVPAHFQAGVLDICTDGVPRMLNLLLGIGGSGTYHMFLSSHPTPVPVNFSPTLWVSASGLVVMLVATAIFVPLNGYLIDRRWAACLICGYIVLMAVNVGVEVRTGRE